MILTKEVDFHCVTVNFVLRTLMADKILTSVSAMSFNNSLQRMKPSPRIVTRDESWVYGNDPETK